MARFLTRVRLENYKSIAHCDVELQDLTFLVGPNGAGKSNFLSALIVISLYQTKRLMPDFSYSNSSRDLFMGNKDKSVVFIEGDFGNIEANFDFMKEVSISANIKSDFPVRYCTPFDLNFIPENYKKPIVSELDDVPNNDGSNIANILRLVQDEYKDEFISINKFMSHIFRDLKKVWVLQAGGYDILQFDVEGNDKPFNASQMSDGTLHALAILTTIFHAKNTGVPLIGIEEPEAGLHPAAARVLYDALAEASQDVQIIVTSHSPDLLDNPDISPDSILAVVRENGETKIGPIDDVSRQVLNEHMFTAGELLRLNRLQPAA